MAFGRESDGIFRVCETLKDLFRNQISAERGYHVLAGAFIRSFPFRKLALNMKTQKIKFTSLKNWTFRLFSSSPHTEQQTAIMCSEYYSSIQEG